MTHGADANGQSWHAGLTERVAAFVSTFRSGDLPPAAREAAKACILDSLGAACVGARRPIADKLTAYLDLEGWNGRNTVVGDSRRASATLAAFANGVLMHCEDFDDSPHTSYFLPALLATAEQVDASGEELIAAWVLAFEVWSVLVPSLGIDRPFNPTSVIGPLAAAIASARLRRFSPAQVANALGIAASHSAGLQRNFGTDTKPMDAGRSARAGVQAAELTALGWSADEQILEGWKGFAAAFGGPKLDLASAERSLGQFAGARVADGRAGVSRAGRRPVLKAWPCCLRNSGPLSALFNVIHEPGFDRSSIEALDVAVGFEPRQTAVFRSDSLPRSGLEAKFCIPYVLAAACQDGDITVASFESPTFERVLSGSLISRVKVRFDPTGAERHGPEFAEVSATLSDGSRRTALVASGFELYGSGIVDKFVTNAAPLLGEAEALHAAEAIRNIEKLASVRELIAAFGRPTLGGGAKS